MTQVKGKKRLVVGQGLRFAETVVKPAVTEASREHTIKTAALARVIRPLRTARYEVDCEWTYFPKAIKNFENDYGGLELNPDFQRGHVWTQEQKTHFIENVLRGVVSSSGFQIQFNCPNWEDENFTGDLPKGVQCIDGLQRISAVADFLSGTVRPFGLSVDDLTGTSFSIKSRYRFRLAMHNFTSRADLLQHYLDLNTGGTPHSADEIARVRQLHESAILAGA